MRVCVCHVRTHKIGWAPGVWMHTDIEKTFRERALKRWTGNANGADNYIKDSLNAHGMTIPNLYQENIDAYPRDWLQKL